MWGGASRTIGEASLQCAFDQNGPCGRDTLAATMVQELSAQPICLCTLKTEHQQNLRTLQNQDAILEHRATFPPRPSRSPERQTTNGGNQMQYPIRQHYDGVLIGKLQHSIQQDMLDSLIVETNGQAAHCVTPEYARYWCVEGNRLTLQPSEAIATIN